MDSIQVTNPFLRSGPSCRRFKSAVQLSLNRSPFKLPALALILAEMLILQAYSPSRSHEYLIDLPSSEVRRSRLNRRKFAISSLGRTFNIFCNTTEDAEAWAAILSYASSRRFDQHYRIERKIGDGRHSQIFLAYPCHGPSTAFIVKVNNRTAECNSFTNRSQFERDAHLKLVQSFDVMPGGRSGGERKIDLDEREHREYTHKLFLEKIVPIRDCFGTTTEDFLVFEHQDGEVLSTALATNGPLSEREARVVMWDLLTAILYMHEQGVLHRDVRASNVFYWRDGGKTCAKLFDLSEARQIPEGISAEEPFRDSPGEPRYKAVEILSGRYHGKPADVWSCGVLLYHMLSGTFPFHGENEQELGDSIIQLLHDQSLFSAPVWASVSSEAISLIRQMLQIDPFKRPSALGARSHQWLSNDLASRRVDAKSAQASPAVEAQGKPRAVAASRGIRKISPLNSSLLPATLEAGRELELRMTWSDSARGELPAATVAFAPIPTDRTQKSVSPTVDTTVGDGKQPEIGCTSSRSLNPESNAGAEIPFPLKSFNSPTSMERCSVVAISGVTRPTFVRSLLRRDPIPAIPSMSTKSPTSPSSSSSRVSSPSPSTYFLNGNVSSEQGAHTHETSHELSKTASHSPSELIPLTKRFPDRQKSGGQQTIFTRHRLAQESKYSSTLCQSRSPRMEPTRALPSGSCSSNHADDISWIKGAEKKAPPDIFSPANRLDDGIRSQARNLNLSSSSPLRNAPDDPLFYFKVNRNGTHVDSHRKSPVKPGLVRRSTKPVTSTSGPSDPFPNIPLRDEMRQKTFVMHSVKAAAEVGLSEFSKRRPLVAKLLFRSPSAQLQLSMVLPYRRKFRTAVIALTAMFRIISLKKGTCLTRRVVRGQTLPTELWTLLTDIRRKCHMRPLRARMPKLLPPDHFGGIMCKPRFEPPPHVETTPLRFWARQREVRFGIFSKAWEVAKEKIVQLSMAVGVGRRGDVEEGHNEGSDRIARLEFVSYFNRRIHGFFRRDIPEGEEEEEKYHHTQEMV